MASPEIVNAVHFSSSFGRSRETDADHAVAGDQIRERFLFKSLGAFGPLRQHEVAQLRVAVPDPHFVVIPERARRIP